MLVNGYSPYLTGPKTLQNEVLYEIDKSYGNYQSALAFLEKSDAYQDSIVENRYDRQLVETEKKYQKQKIELANMRLNIERNRIIIVSGILIQLQKW